MKSLAIALVVGVASASGAENSRIWHVEIMKQKDVSVKTRVIVGYDPPIHNNVNGARIVGRGDPIYRTVTVKKPQVWRERVDWGGKLIDFKGGKAVIRFTGDSISYAQIKYEKGTDYYFTFKQLSNEDVDYIKARLPEQWEKFRPTKKAKPEPKPEPEPK